MNASIMGSQGYDGGKSKTRWFHRLLQMFYGFEIKTKGHTEEEDRKIQKRLDALTATKWSFIVDAAAKEPEEVACGSSCSGDDSDEKEEGKEGGKDPESGKREGEANNSRLSELAEKK